MYNRYTYFEKWRKRNVSNYYTIPLTNSINKLTEKCIKHKSIPFFHILDIINNLQFDSKENKSTFDAISNATNFISSSLIRRKMY